MKLPKEFKCWGLWVPGLIALVMTIGCYFYWNARYTFGYGDNQINRISVIKHLISGKETPRPEALPVNVCYDRMLAPYKDNKGVPVGDIDITDREDLRRFLDSLASWDNYRYIVCDVHFDTLIQTAYDSALFARIASMRDIVVASSDRDPIALKDKVACAEYDQLIKGNRFIKYRFFDRNGSDSAPLRMWKELDGGTLVKKGPVYCSNGRPAVNSVIPDLDYAPEMGWDANGEKNIWNLGADILDMPIDMSSLFKDKIVLIGDWAEYDMHYTIRNQMAGTAILYNSYLSLQKGAHYVRIWVLVILLFTFWLELAFAMRFFWRKPRENLFLSAHPLLQAFCRAAVSWFGYTGLLWIVCAIIYLTSGFFVNAFIIGSIIALVAPYLKAINKK